MSMLQCGVSSCKFSTDEPSQFTLHLKKEHKKDNLFPCKRCHRPFTIPSNLVKHIQTECTSSKESTNKKRKLCLPSTTQVKCADEPTKVSTGTIIKRRPGRPQGKSKTLVETPTSEDTGHSKLLKLKCPTTQKKGFECTNQSLRKKPRPTLSLKENKSLQKINDYTNQNKQKLCLPSTTQVKCADEPTKVTTATIIKRRRGRPKAKSKPLVETPTTEDTGQSKLLKLKCPTKRKKSFECEEHCIASSIPLNAQKNSSQVPVKLKKHTGNKKNKTAETDTCMQTPEQRAPLQKVAQNYEQWSDWWMTITCNKSSVAIKQLQQEESLRHFFTCMDYSCHFHTNNRADFEKHQMHEHPWKKLTCRYCFMEFANGDSLVDHTISVHSTLTEQCSRCLYRAATYTQVLLHFEDVHVGKPVVYSCDSVGLVKFEAAEYVEKAVPEFVSHMMEQKCKCAYCNKGTATIDKLLLHQCLNHPERHIELHFRPSSSSKDEARFECKETKVGLLKTDTNGNIPHFHPNYIRNFPCGLEKCYYILSGIASYKEHLLGYHHCSTFLPCPHCTEISTTFSSFEEHVTMHGPTMYSCSVRDCFFHWEKSSVVAHCGNMHQDSLVNVVTIREMILDEMVPKQKNKTKFVDNKPNSVCTPTNVEMPNEQVPIFDKVFEPIPTLTSRGNYINFHLQLSGNISLSNTLPHMLSFDKSECTCSIGVSDEKKCYCQPCSKQLDAQEFLMTDKNAEYIDENNSNDAREKADLLDNAKVCCFCGYSTTSKDAFKEHLYQELDYLPFLCDICEFKEVSKDKMLQHIEDKHQNELQSVCREVQNETLESWLSLYIDAAPTNYCLSEANRATVLKPSTLCDVPTHLNEKNKDYLGDHLQHQPHARLSCSERLSIVDDNPKHAFEILEENVDYGIRIVNVEGRKEETHSNITTIEAGPSTLDEQKENNTCTNIEKILDSPSVQLNNESQFTRTHCSPNSFSCQNCGEITCSTEHLEFHKSLFQDRVSNLIANTSSDSSSATSNLKEIVVVEDDDDDEDIQVVFSNLNATNSVQEDGRPAERAAEYLDGTPEQQAPEYFSFYGKTPEPFDFSNIRVVSPQSSGLRIAIPVSDLMTFSNFNVRLRVPNLRKSFYNGF